MKVKVLMTRDVKTCGPEDSLARAALLMEEATCGALPVLEGGKPIGIVTDRDICLGLARRDSRPSEMTVGEVMGNGPLHCAGEEDEVERALQLMRRWKVRRLPIVDRGGALRGILSMNDVVRGAGGAGDERGPSYADTLGTLVEICETQRCSPRPGRSRPVVRM